MDKFPYNVIIIVNLLTWVYLWFFKKGHQRLYYFPLFLFLGVTIESLLTAISFSLLPNSIFNHGIVGNIFIIGQLVYMYYLLYQLQMSSGIRQWIQYLTVPVSILTGYLIWESGISKALNIPLVIISSTTIIINILLFMIGSIRKPSLEPIYRKWYFYVISAQLLWNIFSLFYFIPLYYFNINDNPFLVLLHYLFDKLNILTYLFYFAGALCLLYPTKLKSST